MKELNDDEIELCEAVGNEVIRRLLDKMDAYRSAIFCSAETQELRNLGEHIKTTIEHHRALQVDVSTDGKCSLCWPPPNLHGSDLSKTREDVEDTAIETYELKLKCLNCGKTWEQEIPVGMDFFPFQPDADLWQACYASPLRFTADRPRHLSEGEDKVRCPNCGSSRVDRAKEK